MPLPKDKYKEMSRPNTYVPVHLRGGLIRWIEQGIVPGSFLRAMLVFDIDNARVYADPESAMHIATIEQWLWEFAPDECWGGAKEVAQWEGLQVNGSEVDDDPVIRFVTV